MHGTFEKHVSLPSLQQLCFLIPIKNETSQLADLWDRWGYYHEDQDARINL